MKDRFASLVDSIASCPSLSVGIPSLPLVSAFLSGYDHALQATGTQDSPLSGWGRWIESRFWISHSRYRIARAEKHADGQWAIVSVFTVQDKTVEFPIPAQVKFAGDTAVLILDDVRTGAGNAKWSARILLHDDVYTGRWWETGNREHGGTIAGTITRGK